jgi:hypothetical protein
MYLDSSMLGHLWLCLNGYGGYLNRILNSLLYTTTNACLFFVYCLDSSLVNDEHSQVFSIHWACRWVSAVTSPIVSRCSKTTVTEYFFVTRFNVSCTAVAYLHGVSIDYAVDDMGLWKLSVNNFKERAPYFCCNRLAVQKVLTILGMFAHSMSCQIFAFLVKYLPIFVEKRNKSQQNCVSPQSWSASDQPISTQDVKALDCFRLIHFGRLLDDFSERISMGRVQLVF